MSTGPTERYKSGVEHRPLAQGSTPIPGSSLRLRITGFRGWEAAILALRNTNRQSAQSAHYLDWRYETLPGCEPAEVFWLVNERGLGVGMGCLIPRTYWVDGDASTIAVLGDISLDEAYRGQGNGQLFLGALTSYCNQHHPHRVNLVIPTEAARKPLQRLEWHTGGRLIQYVLMLDPGTKLSEKLGNDTLSGPVNIAYRSLLKSMMWLKHSTGYTLEPALDFDDSFDVFWNCFPRKGMVLSDRSLASLKWRYSRHPNQQFQISRLMFNGRLTGYLVYAVERRMCTIYDLLASTPRHLGQMLAAFVRGKMEERVASIRVTLSDTHPYRRAVSWMGFVGRQDDTVFQTYGSPKDQQERNVTWMLTQGDKDI